MKKFILILLILILASNSAKALTFICPITPLSPTGYPCSVPPGTATLPILISGTGLITTPTDLTMEEGTIKFPNEVATGKFYFNSILNSLVIHDGTMVFSGAGFLTKPDVFSGKGIYDNLNILHIEEGAFNLLTVRKAEVVSGELNIIDGSVRVEDKWVKVNNGLNLKAIPRRVGSGFTGLTGIIFKLKIPKDGTDLPNEPPFTNINRLGLADLLDSVKVNQPGLNFEFNPNIVEFKSTKPVPGFILEFNGFEINVESMSPESSIAIDFFLQEIILDKVNANFRFNDVVVQLDSIGKSYITPIIRLVECSKCKIVVGAGQNVEPVITLDAYSPSSLQMPSPNNYIVKGYGQLDIKTPKFTISGALGLFPEEGEVIFSKDETEDHYTIESKNYAGKLHAEGSIILDTKYATTGLGHVEHPEQDHDEADGDNHQKPGHIEDDTHMDFGFGITKAYALGPLRKDHGEESEGEHDEPERSSDDSYLTRLSTEYALSAIGVPETFEFSQGGCRAFSNGEINCKLPLGENAIVIMDVNPAETIFELLNEGKFGLYPKLTLERPLGQLHTSLEIMPLQGSLDFTFSYPLGGGHISFKHERNGATTMMYEREGFEAILQPGFLGLGANLDKLFGIPVNVFLAYGEGDISH